MPQIHGNQIVVGEGSVVVQLPRALCCGLIIRLCSSRGHYPVTYIQRVTQRCYMETAEGEPISSSTNSGGDLEFSIPTTQPSQSLHSRKKVRTLSECIDNNNPQSRPMSRSQSRNSLGIMSSHSSFDMLDQVRYVPQQVQDDSSVSYFKSITASRPHLRNRMTPSPDLAGSEIQITIPAPATNPYLVNGAYPSSSGNVSHPRSSSSPPSSSSSSSLKDSRVSPPMETKGNAPKVLRNMSDERDCPSTQRQLSKNRLIWISPYKERPRYMMDFDQEGVVGVGNFSNVYKARNRLDGCLYAVKRIKAKVTDFMSNGLKEVHALSALQGCKHIIRYHGCWVEDQHLWIQTELCMSNSLEVFVTGVGASSERNSPSYGFADVDLSFHERVCTPTDMLTNIAVREDLTSPGRGDTLPTAKRVDGLLGIPEDLAWIIIEQIAEALLFLHSKGVVHLDIRPANVFIAIASSLSRAPTNSEERNDYTDETLQELLKGLIEGSLILKVGDLGLSCHINDLPGADEGDARYCSREMISGLEASLPSVSLASVFGLKAALTAPPNESQSDMSSVKMDLTKADIFSLGISVYELCKGSPLAAAGDDTEDGSSEWHDIRNGKLDVEIMKKYSRDLFSFVKLMMDPDPSMRPSADVICKHCKTRRKSIGTENVFLETSRESLQDLQALLSRMNVNFQMESDVIKQVTSILRENVP